MENIRGAALMTLSMLGFAIEDVLIKTLGAYISTGQIISTIAAGAALTFAIWFIARGEPVFIRAHLAPKVWLRSMFDVLGTIFFLSALMRLDVTILSAIIQATPLVVALGGVLFLGQTVGWLRWSAIGVGFIGVLFIIRPGLDGVSYATLLGVIGMFGLAGRDLTTRALKIDISGAHLTFHAFLLLMPAGLILTAINGQTLTLVTGTEALTLIACIAVVLLAYLAIVAATRDGDAAFISMFRYTRMVFALFLGMVFLGERPDALTLIGVAIVIGAGIFTLLREARVRTTSKSQPDPL